MMRLSTTCILFTGITVATILMAVTKGCDCVYARHGMTSSVYQTEFRKKFREGYRLKLVNGYSSTNNRARYAAIWVRNTDNRNFVARHGMTGTRYQSEFNKQMRRGYRLVHVSGYGVGNRALFAAIWEKTAGGAWVARHGMTSNQYQLNFNKFTKSPYNYRLTCVNGYTVKGVDYYAAIWERKSDNNAWVARHRMTSASYQHYFDTYGRAGYRLIKVSGYQLRGASRYAAIWERTPGSLYQARHGLSEVNYQAAFDNQHYRGYQLEYVDGYLVGSKIQFAAIWNSQSIWKESDLQNIDNKVNSFLATNNIPGASLAITRYGKLMFAQGYGKADSESNHDASPRNLWRIASISKPVTAVAIMKLVELGDLSLNDKVFGPGSILGDNSAYSGASSRERMITVNHLLMHLAGSKQWNNEGNDGSSDPMFILKDLSQQNLIKEILNTREPSAVPGTDFSYSNFGYCILGRVIEKVTGVSYSAWVNQNVLAPMGVHDMKIAGNTKQDRLVNEVVYYPGTSPYGMNVNRMDSHGGWVASPLNLVRFMVHVDGFSTVVDKLPSNLVTSMTTPSSVYASYAKGWWVNSYNSWWHGGSLPGTMSILVRTQSGYTWSFICNKRDSGDIDALMWQIVNGVTTWPNANFF